MKNIIELIELGFFSEAAVGESEKRLDDTLFEIALANDITAYAFACYLLSKNNHRERHTCIVVLLLGHFCYLEAAEHVVFSHYLLALELNPNDVNLLSFELCLYGSPDNDIEPVVFRQIAKQILLQDKENKRALEVLDETSSIEGQPFIPLGEGLPVKEKIKLLIEKGRLTLRHFTRRVKRPFAGYCT